MRRRAARRGVAGERRHALGPCIDGSFPELSARECGSIDPAGRHQRTAEGAGSGVDGASRGPHYLADRLPFFGSLRDDWFLDNHRNTAFPLFNIARSRSRRARTCRPGESTTRCRRRRPLMVRRSPTFNPAVRPAAKRPSRPGYGRRRPDGQPAGAVVERAPTGGAQPGAGRLLGIRIDRDGPATTWSNSRWRAGHHQWAPRIQFTGLNIAGNNNWPRYWYQNSYQLRDDFTWAYDLGGRHSEGGRRIHVVESSSPPTARAVWAVSTRAAAAAECGADAA